MRRVSAVRGKAVPLNRANVDTDQIIPAKHLKRVDRTGYGPHAFEAWREDPDFVLNNPAHEGANIMLTRENFGSGSSREHAVWALDGIGIEALVGVSFADIFKTNCFQSGLLTVELSSEDVDYLMSLSQSNPDAEIEVDLGNQTVATIDGDWSVSFEIDPFKKSRLQKGQDDISMTLQYSADIEEFERQRTHPLPNTTVE